MSCAVELLKKDELVENIRVFLGAVGIKPVRAELLEAEFSGKKLSDVSIDRLREAAFNEVEKAIPTRDSRFYKRVAIEGLIEEVLGDLMRYEKL